MKKDNLNFKYGIQGILITTIAVVIGLNPFNAHAQQAVDGHNCNVTNTGPQWSAASALVDTDPGSPKPPCTSNLLNYWGVNNGTTLTFAVERECSGNALFAFYLDTDCDSTTGDQLNGANGADYAIRTTLIGAIDSTIYKWNSTTSAFVATSKKAFAAKGKSLCSDPTTDQYFIEFSINTADVFDMCGTTNNGGCGYIKVTQINTHAGAVFTSAPKDEFKVSNKVGINLPPVGDILPKDSVSCGGQVISLNGLASLTGNENLGVTDNITSYQWDTAYNGVTFNPALTGSGSTVTYNTNGTRTLALRVTDAFGCTNIKSLKIDIYNAPVANATLTYVVSPSTPCEIVQADGSSSVDNYAPNNLLYSWNFGDGTTSSLATVTHTYAGCNTYNVLFYVTDPLTAPKCASDTMMWTIALPVEMVEFDLVMLGRNVVKLNWATASEYDNNGWEIQRSVDGVNWTKVGFQNGAGNSQKINEYVWIDPSPVYSSISYYRLKQLDYNGGFNYTVAKKADFTSVNNDDLKLYPNPAIETLSVKIEGVNEDFDGEVTLYNQQGQAIKADMATNASGVTTVDVSKLATGIYFVKTVVYGKESYQQFIKK